MAKFGLGNANFGLFLWWLMCGTVGVSSQVELPPRVMWRRDNQERIIIREGRGANYVQNCTAEGYPAPSLEWRRDGQILTESGEYIKAFRNGTLYFKDFGERENGMYQCIATNRLGKSLSGNVLLVAEKPPRASSGEPPAPVTVEAVEGDPVSLKCAETPATIPEYVKRWYREVKTAEVSLTERVGTDNEGFLRFASVELTDAASYVCALAPRVAHQQDQIRMYNVVKLDVKPGSKVTSEPRLEFSSGNGNVKAYLNQTATLECFFSGFPIPSIKWKNNSNQEVTSENKRFTLEDFQRRLIISPVRPEDEGRFSCTANNGHGEKTELINVNVTSPPFKVANQGLTSLIRPDNTDIALQCQARAANGENLDAPVWYRNGDLLRDENLPDPSRYAFSSDRTLLYIRGLSKTVDTACFQCNVTNSEGHTFYDGFLRVINSIMIATKPNEVTEVTKNDVIDISVRATGDSCCLINKHWYFNEKLLTPEDLQVPPLMLDLNTDTLVFNATSVSDGVLESWFGQYRCLVSNTYQEVNVKFSILKKGTAAPETAGIEFELWWLAIILGVLVIIIAILIIVCCIKRNYPRETYQLEKTELKHHLNPEEELLDQTFQEI